MFQGWHFLHARSLLNLLSCNLPCKTWGAGFPGCGLTPGIRARDDTAYHAYHGNIYLRCFLWYKRVGICKFPRGKFSRFFSLPVTNSSHLKMNENSMVSNRNLQTSRGGKKSGSMLNFRGMTLSKYLPLHHL